MATGFSARGSEDLSQVLEKMLGISPKIRAIAGAAPGGGAGAANEGRRGGGGQGAAGAGSREQGPSGGQDAPAPAGEGAAGRRGVQAEDSVLNATVRATAAGNAAAESAANAPTAPGQAAPRPVAQADPEVPDHDPDATALTGVDLIQRTLGGQVIAEIGDA
jgi:hypothetical protein